MPESVPNSMNLILKSVLIFFLSFLFLKTLNAQDSSLIKKKRISFGYFAETYTHPGLTMNYSCLLKYKTKEKIKKNGKTKLRKYEFLWDNRFAFYNHPQNHTGFMLTTGTSISRITKKNFYFNLGLFTGLLHKYLNEDTYEVNSNGYVTEVKFAGNTMFTYGFKTEFGKNFTIKKIDKPISIYLGSNLFFSAPFASSQIFNNAMQLGVVYKF